MKYTYLLVNVLSAVVPFAYSFTARSGFSRRFGPAFAAIACVGLPMIAWDALFTARGVWGFNPAYHLGLEFFGLPLEEMLFFVCIPFSCLFIYDSLRPYRKWHVPERPARLALAAAALLLLIAGGVNLERAYTSVCFLVAAAFAAVWAWKPRGHAGLFATTYLIHLVPFFIVNGILTALPVVVYNDAENLALRLGTIPVEDAAYSLILLGGTTWLYEAFQRRPA
jgi:lycopene cyclase domain-containing protein